MVLRPFNTAGRDKFELVGEAYVHGKMNGEAVADLEEEDFENAEVSSTRGNRSRELIDGHRVNMALVQLPILHLPCSQTSKLHQRPPRCILQLHVTLISFVL